MSCCGLPWPKMLPCRFFCDKVRAATLSVTSVSITAPIAVNTHVPPLAVIDRYLSMSAPLILPTVTMTLCAMLPAVSSAICASAVFDVRRCLGGAEFERQIVLPFGWLDCEHVTRARVHRALQRRHPDAAEADDDYILARPERPTTAGGSPRRAHLWFSLRSLQLIGQHLSQLMNVDLAGAAAGNGVIGVDQQPHRRNLEGTQPLSRCRMQLFDGGV